MITIFNRKELCITLDLKKQAEIRECLQAHQIDYEIKTVNRMSSSPFEAGTRARVGSAGQKTELEREYIFYVRKADYERTKKLLFDYKISLQEK